MKLPVNVKKKADRVIENSENGDMIRLLIKCEDKGNLHWTMDAVDIEIKDDIDEVLNTNIKKAMYNVHSDLENKSWYYSDFEKRLIKITDIVRVYPDFIKIKEDL